MRDDKVNNTVISGQRRLGRFFSIPVLLLFLSIFIFSFDIHAGGLKTALGMEGDRHESIILQNKSEKSDFSFDISRETAISVDLNHLLMGSYYVPRQSFTGNYLAGRFAQSQQDWARAAGFMAQAVEFSNSPQRIQDNAFVLLIGAGEIEQAYQMASRIRQAQQAGQMEHGLSADIQPLADMLFLLKQIATLPAIDHEKIEENEALNTVLESLEHAEFSGLHLYIQAIIEGWIHVMRNDIDGVFTALDRIPVFANGERSIIYHLYAATMLDRMGQEKGAAAHYYRLLEESAPIHTTYYINQFFKRIGDADTVKILARAVQASGQMQSSSVELANKDLKQLIAGSLFDLTSYLYEQRGYESALIFTQIARYLDHDLYDADMMLGDLMGIYGRFDQSLAYYQRVPPSHSSYITARIRLAEAYEKNNMTHMARSILQDIENYKESQNLMVRLGDIYRRDGQFDEAISHYDAALAMIDQAERNRSGYETWRLYYARGISYDQRGQWTEAEQDLIAALELNPDQPLILNYLGYSWVDRNKNLEQALEMIQRALARRPYDGYILDSAGWALYRLGRYDEAVIMLERAVQMLPNDPIIHDHLGDVYWAVGRYNEARFEWGKALQVTEDDKRIYAIRAKIQTGLPVSETIAQTADIKQ